MGPLTAPFLLNLPSPGDVVGCGGGGETLSLAQVVFPPPWEFEREQVLVHFFSLHLACSAWHWVSLLLLLIES